MHLPCKQADVGALPTDSTNLNCGENEIQASLISSASVGATPTPATNLSIYPRASFQGTKLPVSTRNPIPGAASPARRGYQRVV